MRRLRSSSPKAQIGLRTGSRAPRSEPVWQPSGRRWKRRWRTSPAAATRTSTSSRDTSSVSILAAIPVSSLLICMTHAQDTAQMVTTRRRTRPRTTTFTRRTSDTGKSQSSIPSFSHRCSPARLRCGPAAASRRRHLPSRRCAQGESQLSPTHLRPRLPGRISPPSRSAAAHSTTRRAPSTGSRPPRRKQSEALFGHSASTRPGYRSASRATRRISRFDTSWRVLQEWAW